jgi:hypothetical protein
MQDPANIPFEVICQLEAMKHESTVYQFQSIYCGSQYQYKAKKIDRDITYRDLAAASHVHAVHGHGCCCGRAGRRPRR